MNVDDRTPREDRAQTAIDFVVGMGVFLLAAAFVFMFVPSMFAPFFGPGIGDPVTADRAVNHLVEEQLAEEDAPAGVLAPDAVDSFFDECEDGAPESLGIEQRNARVELVGYSEYECGPAPEGSVTVSKRLVVQEGNQTMLRVSVW